MAKTCTIIEHYNINTKTLGGIKLSALSSRHCFWACPISPLWNGISLMWLVIIWRSVGVTVGMQRQLCARELEGMGCIGKFRWSINITSIVCEGYVSSLVGTKSYLLIIDLRLFPDYCILSYYLKLSCHIWNCIRCNYPNAYGTIYYFLILCKILNASIYVRLWDVG